MHKAANISTHDIHPPTFSNNAREKASLSTKVKSYEDDKLIKKN